MPLSCQPLPESQQSGLGSIIKYRFQTGVISSVNVSQCVCLLVQRLLGLIYGLLLRLAFWGLLFYCYTNSRKPVFLFFLYQMMN